MNDAIAVALVMRAPLMRLLWMLSPAGISAELRERREGLALVIFELGTGIGLGP